MVPRDRYEKHIAELEDELNSLKSENQELKKSRDGEVAKAAGMKEKYMLHLSQFLTGLYTSLGKTQNDILKQSVNLNEHLASVAEKRNEAMSRNFTQTAIGWQEEE